MFPYLLPHYIVSECSRNVCVLTACWFVLLSNMALADSELSESYEYMVNGRNYSFYHTYNYSALNWTAAREFCRKKDLTLPVITDNDVNSKLQQFLNDSSVNRTWIDVRARNANDSKWYWINGNSTG